MCQKKRPNLLNSVQHFFAQNLTLRVSKIRNFMEILKNKTALWQNAPERRYLEKLKYSTKKWQSKNYAFFVNNSFLAFLSHNYAWFSETPQNYGFFYTHECLFWAIFFTLLKGFCHFLKTKIAINMRILKIEKSTFSTLFLEFWPKSNHIFRFPEFWKKSKFDPP